MSRMGFGTGSIGFRTKQARWVKNNPKKSGPWKIKKQLIYFIDVMKEDKLF